MIPSQTTTGGTEAHWGTRPLGSLAPGQQEIVSSYAALNADINLTYQGATTGAQFVMYVKTPSAGDNKATGSSSSTSYSVTAQAASGMNPTFN